MAGRADVLVRRAQARDVEWVASFVSRALGGDTDIDAETVLSRLGDVAFFLAEREGNLVGLTGWRVENLVARVTDLLIWPSSARSEVGRALFREMESGAMGLQAEAAVLFLPRSSRQELIEFAEALGYEARVVGDMPRAWRETAHEAGREDGEQIMVKQLRSQRVMSPL